MKVLLLGAAGFIGTNLVIRLAKDPNNEITAVDKDMTYFSTLKNMGYPNVIYKESSLEVDDDYEALVDNQDIVFHLISSTVPSTSNINVAEELKANVILSANLFEACIKKGVQKVVFISSGGTVYGKESECPISEENATNPITSYGVQKITIEKLLYLYNHMYGLDYRIIRLANPYGPYQRPNGVLGAVTTFTYKALKGEEIKVFGDGSVIRDFIYIDDAINGIMKIVEGNDKYRTFNLGSGYGTSINELLTLIGKVLGKTISINYLDARNVDVPINYLDIKRFETTYGKLNPISLHDGISKTVSFMLNNYPEFQ